MSGPLSPVEIQQLAVLAMRASATDLAQLSDHAFASLMRELLKAREAKAFARNEAAASRAVEFLVERVTHATAVPGVPLAYRITGKELLPGSWAFWFALVWFNVKTMELEHRVEMLAHGQTRTLEIPALRRGVTLVGNSPPGVIVEGVPEDGADERLRAAWMPDAGTGQPNARVFPLFADMHGALLEHGLCVAELLAPTVTRRGRPSANPMAGEPAVRAEKMRGLGWLDLPRAVGRFYRVQSFGLSGNIPFAIIEEAPLIKRSYDEVKAKEVRYSRRRSSGRYNEALLGETVPFLLGRPPVMLSGRAAHPGLEFESVSAQTICGVQYVADAIGRLHEYTIKLAQIWDAQGEAGWASHFGTPMPLAVAATRQAVII